MNLEKLKDTARKFEQKEDWRKAIEVYQKVLQAFEAGQDSTPDLALYNRVGDLYLKVNDTTSAVHAYERAVELYAEQGFANNAIALCGKILRVSPGRVQTYLQLAQLHARKNVVFETKKNLIEYLERMNSAGQRDEALQAVKRFADQFATSEDIRLMLAELLRAASRGAEAREQLEKLATELEARGDRAGARRTRERMQSIDVEVQPAPGEPEAPPKKRGAALVFLDTGVEVPGAKRPAPAGTEPPPALAEEPAAEVEPREIEPPTDEVPLSMADLESTSLEADSLEEAAVEPLEGLEQTAETDDLTIEPMDHTGLVSDLTIDLGSESEALQPERIEQDALLGDIDLSLEIAPQAESFVLPEESIWSEDDLAAHVADEPPPVEEPGPGIAFLEVDTPVEATVEQLEELILDDPDNPETHRALGEALLGAGEHERGIEELDLALARYEEREDWDHAGDVASELARLEPTTIRYYQKRVELAFRTGERARLIDAYLELGDALVRTGALEKAVAVYRRVAEHDSDNPRARAALESLSPPAPPEPPRPAPEAAPTRAPGFVDLGALVLDEDRPPAKDTRMRVQDEEPTGDEQRDFEEMLKQFKRGIEENLEADDFQSHYDLGVAFKEMGLLDEAIAEFQRALRAPEGRLRTSEALGASFFEKGQFAVAEAILRRAVEGLSGQDDEKIGLLYWLGRSLEAEGRTPEARPYYQRALAVDINFMDLAGRLRGFAGGPTA
jgi:tetratricopeptide (TPR) repeat protein